MSHVGEANDVLYLCGKQTRSHVGGHVWKTNEVSCRRSKRGLMYRKQTLSTVGEANGVSCSENKRGLM